MLSRIAIYVSVALLFLSIRSPLWSAYVDLLSRSDTLRQFVLQNDLRSRGSRPRRSPAEVQASSQLAINELIETAKQATASNQWNVAAEGYRRAIAACEVRLRAGGGAGNLARNDLALALNNLAWLLCTCPDPKILDGDGAVALARRAVEVVRDEGIYWNTLGAAYYRAQKYEEAKSALFRSMELRDEGDSFDWFFLGMTYARLGRLDKGRDWYVRASEWFRARKSQDPELYRFQVETAERLGLPRPSPPPPLPVVVQQPRPLDFMPRGMRGPRRNQGPRIFPGIPGLESNNR